jgi:hypothetical protein
MDQLDDWGRILACLPDDLEERAKATGAFTRARGVPNAKALLRLILAYCATPMSFRQTVTWAKSQNIAHLSDVSLIARMEHCEAWLSDLLQSCLASIPPPAVKRPIHLIDATHIVASNDKLWRLHVAYDACRQSIEQVKLADAHTMEKFSHFTPRPGVLYLADRAYGYANGIQHILDGQAQVLCRVKAKKYMPHADPKKIVEIEAPQGRIIVAPIPQEKLAKMVKRMKRRAQRSQRKISDKTLAANQFLCLFCSDDSLTAQEVVDLYRWRWQIELLFKRLKSLQHLDEMAVKSPKLIPVYLLCHLLLAFISQRFQHEALFPPQIA